MRPILCLLLVLFPIYTAQAGSAPSPGKKQFDMPVREWLRLPAGEKGAGAGELLSLHARGVTR